MTVTLDGRVGEIPFWRLEATFRGEFLVAPDAEITAEQVAEIHGPAWLYSAAREYVADVTRRTKVGAGLILSPFHFAKSASE